MGAGAGRTASHGATWAAAMLSSRMTSGRCAATVASTRLPATALSANGRWGTDANAHRARPVALGLPAALDDADLIHTHHLRSTPSRIAALTGRVRGRRLVVTDHGLGGGGWGGLLPRLFDRV